MLPPPVKLASSDLRQLSQVNEALLDGAINCDRAVLQAWVDKTIRLVEFNRRGLKKLFATRFPDSDAHAVVLSLLIRRAWPSQQLLASGMAAKPDMRALNAALWIGDVSSSLVQSASFVEAVSELHKVSGALPRYVDGRANSDWCEVFAETPVLTTADSAKASAGSAPVVLFSPSRKSRNSVATLHRLADLEVNVSDIFVRRIGSVSRLREELRFSPQFLVKRVVNELLRPSARRPQSDSADLTALLARMGCQERTVEEIAERFPNVRVRYFTNFNSDRCLAELKALRPSYGVFTGGGIIREKTLETFEHGIIHAHPGILPQYKGMDVVQWAVLEGRYDAIGSTCQIMSPALDAGALLSNDLIDSTASKSLNDLRTAVVERKIDLLAATCSGFVSGRITATEHPESGRQYMLMHPRLVEVVSYILQNGHHRSAG